MLSKKSKGLFIEYNRYSILTATTTSLTPPFTLESLNEFSLTELDGFEEYIESLLTNKSVRYVPSHCSVYPPSRFIRKHTVESMAKAKDESYFSEVLNQNYRIDASKHKFFPVNTSSGKLFNTEESLNAQKELLLCGAELAELIEYQEKLVEAGVFPQSLQLGTLSTLAGIKDYLSWKKSNSPILTIEVNPENSQLFILLPTSIDLSRPIPFGVKSMFPIVQKELGLKDEESAKKLFYSDTFDFTEMGSSLLRKVLKEIQASTGFYEVQTGQTIESLMLHVLPQNLKWIPSVISKEIGIDMLDLDLVGWLESFGVTLGDEIHRESLDSRWFGLFSLFGNLEERDYGQEEE